MNRSGNAFQELREERVCSKCKKKYKEESNMGTWKCKQHPAHIEPYGNTGTYYFPCCGENTWTISSINDYWSRRPGSGCVPCDHRSNTLAPYNDIDTSGVLVVPSTVVEYFQIEESKREEHEKSVQKGTLYKVYRYDWKNKVYESKNP